MTTTPAIETARENLRVQQDIEELAERARLERELSSVPGRVAGEGVPVAIHDPTQLVPVYDHMGEPRMVPIWTTDGKNSILRRRVPGSTKRAFTVDPPEGSTWKRGEVLCLLARNHPDRPRMDEIGLQGRFCDPFGGRDAEHLASPWAMRQHMAHKHKDEWALIQFHEGEASRKFYEDNQSKLAEATLSQSATMAALVEQLMKQNQMLAQMQGVALQGPPATEVPTEASAEPETPPEDEPLEVPEAPKKGK